MLILWTSLETAGGYKAWRPGHLS